MAANETKRTPGPWRAERQGNGQWFVLAESGYPVCRVARWSKENDAADALLIAAAPEMLEALRDSERHLSACGNAPRETLAFVRSIIAKAESR